MKDVIDEVVKTYELFMDGVLTNGSDF